MNNFNWKHQELAKVEKAAAKNNRNACFELGMRYLDGRARSTGDNQRDGFYWVMQAALSGHVGAMNCVGYCLEHGMGTEPDFDAAYEWFMEAARKGDADAYFNLGCCRLVGVGAQKSKAAAKVWLEGAAERGHNRARQMLDALEVREAQPTEPEQIAVSAPAPTATCARLADAELKSAA